MRLASDWRLQAALAGLVVALAVAVGVAWGRRTAQRPGLPAREAPLPEAHAIWDSWRAAWEGDAAVYLACFAPSARRELEARLAAKGRGAFAEELRATARAALAIELEPPQPRGDGLVFPVVVRREREVERFAYRVVRTGGVWRIAEIASCGRRPAAAPPPAKQGDER